MATSISSCCFFYSCTTPSIPNNSISTTHFTLSFSRSIFTGISLRRISCCSSRILAKFEKFQGDSSRDNIEEATKLQEQLQTIQEEEDDSCLPSDLEGAVQQSGQASALFVSSGGMRAIVELLIPQLWELSRIFLDKLIEETGGQRVKAIFPDAGAAALLKYKWKDAAFGFSSLRDRKHVQSEDEIVVMIVPDYQMLENVQKIASGLSDDPASHHVERLISEDVGVGINVRNLRRYFLSTFTTVYSMRPLPAGAVFRCYPGKWKVFYDDKDRPNRYLLAKEFMSRPDAEELEMTFGNTEEKSEQGPSFFDKAAGIFSSLNRFMRAIAK